MAVERRKIGNVKFTTEMYDVLYVLVFKSKDYEGTKLHSAGWYRDKVREELKLQDSENSSLRSYEEKLRQIRDSLKIKNPLDFPFTIGALSKYNINPEIWPIILGLLKRVKILTYSISSSLPKNIEPQNVSIRHVLWISRLYPLYKTLKNKNEDISSRDLELMNTAWIYAVSERISEAQNRAVLDTSKLDDKIFGEKSGDNKKAFILNELLES